jgi:hypothetical protein
MSSSMGIVERDEEIARLQAKVNALTNQLESAQQASRHTAQKRRQMSPHAVHVEVEKGKRPVMQPQGVRMGRNASICTQEVMAALPSTDGDYAQHPLAVRILEMFQHPASHID